MRKPAARGIWERRMREIRTSGVTRGERCRVQGMQRLSHARGNPETDVGCSLNTYHRSPTLLIFVVNYSRFLVASLSRPLRPSDE